MYRILQYEANAYGRAGRRHCPTRVREAADNVVSLR
jgi:hypothetical protein